MLPADSELCTPLHSAARQGELPCIRLLLVHCRADELGRPSRTFATPLAVAIRRKHATLALALRHEYGAPLDAHAVLLCLTTQQRPLLEQLLQKPHAAAGETISAGADGVDAPAAGGVTALHLAAEGPKEGDGEATVRQLLELRAAVGLADSDGHTALHRAAFHGSGRVVGLLVAAGASPDQQDHEGNTALHHAGRGAQEFVFDVLELKHGADPEVRNHAGELPALQPEPCHVQ